MAAVWPLLATALLLARWAGAETLELRVAAGSDDAEEAPSGAVNTGSSDLELVRDDSHGDGGSQIVGIRFAKANVAPKATIAGASLQFTARNAGTEPCRLTIRGELAANAASFAATPKNVSSRPPTAASVSWSPPPWGAGSSGAGERTPDLAAIVQEIVNQPGWASGGAMAFVVTGAGQRNAMSFEGAKANGAPLLRVEWSGGVTPPPPPPVASPKPLPTTGTTLPPPKPMVASPPAVAPHAALGGGQVEPLAPAFSAGSAFNAWLDDLSVAGMRFADLPLSVVAAAGFVVAALLVLVAWVAARRARRRGVVVGLTAFLAVAGVVGGLAWWEDQRLDDLLGEIRELRSREDTNTLGLLDIVRGQHAKRKAFLFDTDLAAREVRQTFGEVRLLPLIHDQATDVVFLRGVSPEVQVYVAVVDLECPSVVLCIGASLKEKSLTSAFAKTNGCAVAINGEAGQSPGPRSGFGEWIGNLVIRGEPVVLEDSAKRPFLAFDRRNRATYFPAAVVDRGAGTNRHNVIWGRHDALVNGVVADPRQAARQPRTAMGINAAGTRLYLLVADGRQPGYSVGLTHAEVARTLHAFGARHGMLCDEGGSSCIYLGRFGGICNVPSDNRGRERPTYTHFGIALRSTP